DTSGLSFGVISNWNWDFGDGSSSTQQHPVRTYLTSDTFTVRLVVNTTRQCRDTVEGAVIVYPSPGNNLIGVDDTICSGSQTNALSGSVPTGGTGVYQYRWESSTDHISWTSVSGGTNQNLSAQTLTGSTWYRRVVTSSPCDTNQQSISN